MCRQIFAVCYRYLPTQQSSFKEIIHKARFWLNSTHLKYIFGVFIYSFKKFQTNRKVQEWSEQQYTTHILLYQLLTTCHILINIHGTWSKEVAAVLLWAGGGLEVGQAPLSLPYPGSSHYHPLTVPRNMMNTREKGNP